MDGKLNVKSRMRTIAGLAFIFFWVLAGPAFGFESISDKEMSDFRGTAGLVLDMFAGDVLGEPGLSSEQAMQRWKNMTPEQKDLARKNFRQKLLSMSPEERAEIRQRMIQRFESLPADQQAQMREDMRTRLNSMSTQEKSEFQTFRNQMLTPSGSTPGGAGRTQGGMGPGAGGPGR